MKPSSHFSKIGSTTTFKMHTTLKKPLLIAEFGKSSKDYGYNTNKRDELFNLVYSSIYSSAVKNGAAAGAMFWQLLTQGTVNFRDSYEIIFSESPSTARLIAEQSQKLDKIRKMHEKRKF